MATKEQEQTLALLHEGAQKSFLNAEKLFLEAQELARTGATSRAYFLHQISLEECAKVDILASSTFQMLADKPVDLAKLKKTISSHERKNRTNAYFLDQSEAEISAETAKDAHAAFSQIQQSFHKSSNDAKNLSLYVNLDGEKFSSPEENITQQMLAEISALNEKFLALAFQLQKSVRAEGFTEGFDRMYQMLESKLTELKDKNPDPSKGDLSEILLSVIESELAARKKR